MMRTAGIGLLALAILGTAPLSLAQSAPLHLFFSKKINASPAQELLSYTVRPGDCLSSILHSFQIPQNRIWAMTQKVVELNPQIDDPHILFPGTTLTLPLTQSHSPLNQNQEPSPMRPEPLFASPPSPLSADKQNGFTAPPGPQSLLRTRSRPPRLLHPLPELSPCPQAFLQEGKPEQDSPSHLPQARVLEKLKYTGLEFATGKDLLYPGPEKWLRLDLEKTPLAMTPWGTSLLFVPKGALSSDEFFSWQKSGLSLCPIPSDWSPVQVFAALEESLSPHFMAWTPKTPMILPTPNGSIEITSQTALVLDPGGDRRCCRQHARGRDACSRSRRGSPDLYLSPLKGTLSRGFARLSPPSVYLHPDTILTSTGRSPEGPAKSTDRIFVHP